MSCPSRVRACLTPSAAQTPPLCLDDEGTCPVTAERPVEPTAPMEPAPQVEAPGEPFVGGSIGEPLGASGPFLGSGLPPGVAGAFELRASRTLVGPHVFPPEDYAAYGIVAFPELSSSATRGRHLLVCEAYVATLPEVSDLNIPPAEQMATVWPVNSEDLAAELSELDEHRIALRHAAPRSTTMTSRRHLLPSDRPDGPRASISAIRVRTSWPGRPRRPRGRGRPGVGRGSVGRQNFGGHAHALAGVAQPDRAG